MTRRVEIDGTFHGWRSAARVLLLEEVPPEAVLWQSGESDQTMLDGLSPADPGGVGAQRDEVYVPRRFLQLARAVACHRDPERWARLYRALWRLAAGEPHLLSIASDRDVYPLLQMARAVRRASHKMKAFVRFRAVAVPGGEAPAYVAWFEPAHPVLEATAPFFVRRFRSMAWSILTPERSAHWDRQDLRFAPGVARTAAPRQDELEELWRVYYAGIFNPARLRLSAMRAEMPKRYWSNLPEAALIADLARQAPRRTADMLAQVFQPPADLPPDCRSAGGEPLPTRPGADPVHDPGLAAAADRYRRADRFAPAGLTTRGGSRILVGVAGWTDPTLTGSHVFYPPGVNSPEDRLRHYAARFPLVEVDSTYYTLPTRGMAAAWAARTPPGFTFDVKAHGLMTGHGADLRRLPDWLRRELPHTLARQGRIYGRDLPAVLLGEVWRRFLAALEPLRTTGKLGAVLLQYPRWFKPSRESARSLREVRDRLGGVSGAIEFRHRSWMTGRVADRTLGLLGELDLAYVVVSAPQGMESSMPPVAAVTSSRLAVFRLHGLRRETWETRNESATERYRYLYDEAQLEEHLRQVLELSRRKEAALHIVYNNCHGNYGVTNAAELTFLLQDARGSLAG